MTGHRLLRSAGALAVAWLVTAAAPVAAQEGTVGHLSASGDPVTITGMVEGGPSDSVMAIGLTLRPTGGQQASVQSADGCELSSDGCGSGHSSVSFSWSPSLPYNGPYVVEGTADVRRCTLLGLSCTTSEGRLDPATFVVAVPPAAPTNVRATVADGKATVTWSAGGSYPDLIGYALFRKAPGGAFQLMPQGVTGTSAVDAQPPAGLVQYQVAAVRSGAVPGDSSTWLATRSEPASVNVPPATPSSVPTGSPGDPAAPPPAAGPQPGGAIGNTPDLGSLFSSSATPAPQFPSSPALTLPDTFSETLPFSSVPGGGAGAAGGKVEGRQTGRPAATSGSGGVESANDNLSDSNRRALLVPVAAGSVLCVSALHLRWLNRRLGASPARGGGPRGPAGDLEHTDLEPEAFAPDRQPVGAGVGPHTGLD